MSTPSKPPFPGQPDYYRNQLNELATKKSVSVGCKEEHDEPASTWWATYRVVNSDGSDGKYLGSSSGTKKSIAREYAAKQALGELTSFLAA